MSDKTERIIVVGISSMVRLFIYPLVIMFVWTLLIPKLFGLPNITYWQAFGLRVLCVFLTDDKKFINDELSNL